MKKLFPFVALFCLSYSYAQFLPMLEEDNVWNIDFYVDPFGGGPTGIISSEIYLADETIINSETYKSVYIDGVQGSCLVREENGIVYRYDLDTAQEYIMYDFTLEVGNVFIIPSVMYNSYCAANDFYNGFDEFTVIDKTTMFIAGEDRIVITFDYISEQGIQCQWIEGIGSNLGFDPVGDSIDIGSRYLVCFTKNTTTYFFNGATACDNTTLNVSENLKDQIVLAPNPVHDISILQLPSILEIDKLLIYDLSGRVISEKDIVNNYITINAMDYASGLYFYKAFGDNKHIKTERFIVN